MSRFTNRIKSLRGQYQGLEAQKRAIEDNIARFDESMIETKRNIELCDKTAILINNVSIDAKKKAVAVLEDMVTDALQTISDGQYGFQILIEDTPKGCKCEFYVTEMVDGELSLQRPQDSNGGGFVDIISATLRYVYLNVFKDPAIKGTVILDEPGKMISEDMSCKFGEFIKKLGEDFDRQTIMVTHKVGIGYMADNNMIIRKVQ